MRNGSKHLVVLGLVLSVVGLSAQVPGRVVVADGAGLSGVHIRSERDHSDSAADGAFTLSGRGRVVRFSKTGYRPITKRLTDLPRGSRVTLTKDPEGQWQPPSCPASKKGETISGVFMGFAVPEGLQLRKISEADFRVNIVCRGKDCLQHSYGSPWSYEGPPVAENLLAGVRDLKERDVTWPSDPEPGVEYRGQHPDGKYFRFVNIVNETVSYEQTVKESADQFDALIDSLCWIQR